MTGTDKTKSLSKVEIAEAIRATADVLGHAPSRSEFKSRSGLSDYHVLAHFQNWREAVRAAGLAPDCSNIQLSDEELLHDWGALVRKHRLIPTRDFYRREGTYSPGVFEKHFGQWSKIPRKFREYARDKSDWADVITILPVTEVTVTVNNNANLPNTRIQRHVSIATPSKLNDRPTYGNPIDFRGLRHEPVNEQGVVFLFGMIAREIGFLVEAVQTGFPDCEAKRQISNGKWQRVRIEFEFESRNFRDHGHDSNGCDVVICWRHNWPECPLEVVELQSIIKTLGKS